MAGPTPSTIKRLFAVSGNQCAFPGCITPLVDSDSGSVLGEICHIKAQSPDGPRYDPGQDEKARHGFKNLLLLCPTHYKIVDDNPDTYPAERLLEIKAQHDKSHANKPKPSDEVIELFLTHVGDVVYGDKFGGDKVLGDKITINVTYQGAQVAIPSLEAVAAHRAALREKLEADTRRRWGGMDFYIQEEGATLPVEASPYQEGRLGARENLLQALGSADRLLVLGEPGSGKTVSLERLAWGLCGRRTCGS